MMAVAWFNRNGALRSGTEDAFEREKVERDDAVEIARADTYAELEAKVAAIYPDGLPPMPGLLVK